MKKQDIKGDLSTGFKESNEVISEDLLNQEAVILAQGETYFGVPIYSYIKFPMHNFMRLREAMIKGENFKPSDFGEVIAAGKGDPPEELREKMKKEYGLISTSNSPIKDEPSPCVNDQSQQETIESMPGLNLETSKQIKNLGRKLDIKINNNDTV